MATYLLKVDDVVVGRWTGEYPDDYSLRTVLAQFNVFPAVGELDVLIEKPVMLKEHKVAMEIEN